MRHYYAFYHTYGINSSYGGAPVGTLYRFASERGRAEWLSAESYDGGNVHRESVSASTARRLLERSFMQSCQSDIDSVLGYGASCEMAFWRRAASIDQLWDICGGGEV
jgi:hypothetical protein